MIEHRILTTENVPFTYRVAGVGARFLAWCVDLTAIGCLVLTGIGLGLLMEFLSKDHGYGVAVIIVWVTFTALCYFFLWEWLWSGQTPGKRVMGIRVITWQGTGVSFYHALVRNLLRLVDAMPLLFGASLVYFLLFAWLLGGYGLGLAVMCTNLTSRRLGDLAAGTLVVHVESVAAPLRSVQEQTTADVPRRELLWRQRLNSLTREQKQTLIDVCLRREQLRVDYRTRLFNTLSQFLQSQLQLTPLKHQSDEKFVQQAAVLLTSAPGER